MSDNDARINLGRIIREKRVMSDLSLRQLSETTGVSLAHLARIERGGRFPSAKILRRIAGPLGFEEIELLYQAGFLAHIPPAAEGKQGVRQVRRVDPDVEMVLSKEPVEVQRTVVAILSILEGLARVHRERGNIEFAEYAHMKYPHIDDDLITMIEDILEGENRIGAGPAGESQGGGDQVNDGLEGTQGEKK